MNLHLSMQNNAIVHYAEPFPSWGDFEISFAWKQTMDDEEKRKFQLVAGDLLKGLGYDA